MKVSYRAPKKTDLDGMLAFVNELAEEDTYVAVERQTRKKEKTWLDDLLKSIEKKNSVMVVAEADGKIIGNCGIKRRDVRKRMRHVGVLGVSVLKEFRGKGIGKALLGKVMALAKGKLGIRLATLSAFANNPIAPKLYMRMGFRKCGRVPGALGFRGKYVDEIYMFKKL